MAQGTDIPAWIALLAGLYAAAAALGELRRPGGWAAMVGELEQGHGLRFLTGVVCIGLGGAIYLVAPWRPDDWLAVLVTVIGGVMVVEGAAILALGDAFMRVAGRILGRHSHLWAWASLVLGAFLIASALLRL